MDTWHDVGHDLSSRQKGIRAGKKSFFLLCSRERREESQGLLSAINEFSSVEFVEPRVKVHLFGKGYACVPEKGNFTKDPREGFGGTRGFGIRKCPRDFLRLLLRSKR